MTDTCGCCQGYSDLVAQVYNRPGLSRVSYRIGTFSTFLDAMLARISRVELDWHGTPIRPFEVPPKSWTSRDSSDQGIATLEMFAYVAHVLTFYQQTTFNEALLRTAALRESVIALAATLGYLPAPGVAAEVLLAFTLEKQKQLLIPVGLRVQSVPEPGQKPQKFETIEAVQTDALLNKVRIFPLPLANTSLDSGSTGSVLLRTQTLKRPLVAGSNVVVVSGTSAEDKQIAAVAEADGRQTVEWSPAIANGGAGARMFQWTDKLRLSGQNAPAKFITTTVVSPLEVTFTETTTAFNIAANATSLNLDGVYPNLKKGQQLLIRGSGLAQLVTLSDVVEVNDSIGGLNTTVSQIQFPLAQALPAIADRRTITVYVLGEEVLFEPLKYDPEIAINENTIYLETPHEFVVPGRTLILDDAANVPQSVTVTSVTTSGAGLAAGITPVLARALDSASSFLLGNVAEATHGETVKSEVLGNGDASATFQLFKLAKSPVTHVATPGAPNGAASTLEIFVDGVRWTEAPSFFGRSGDERIFTTTRDNDEVMSARFGDGLTGARLTSGRSNVVARYRYGLGTVGNLKAGAIRNPLDRPTGLKSAINPLPSGGGADAEKIEDARENAPNTVRTFGRIVSVRDFADAAREFNGIAKALAVVDWDGEEQVVFLTVAGDGGAPLTSQVFENLLADLDSRRDPHRGLRVVEYRSVPIQIETAILVDTDRVVDEVTNAVAGALAAFLAFDNVELGRPVHLSDVFAAIQAVPGVTACDINRLQFKNATDQASHGATADAVQPRLRIFRDELPGLEDAITDVVVTVGMP